MGRKNGTFYCKWCGKITTTSLEGDATLCLNNPYLLKYKNKVINEIKKDFTEIATEAGQKTSDELKGIVLYSEFSKYLEQKLKELKTN